ncbi:MAG: radical SAM family heme chaperone HemW [Actinomycetota bacterium]|nr:radical SAM family heme chaperone HemW [Actinomycetota bacterium]
MSGHVRHLYVHVPFCAHRCGYCDFVTVVGREGLHGRYVDALLAELDLEADVLAPALETIFLGGGTPTFAEGRELRRLLGSLPPAAELTVEANPETVTPELAQMLREAGVTRVSLGAQSFQSDLLRVLERRAGPDDVRRAFYHLRDANFDNISLDLLHGIPGQSPAALELDIEEALALAPEHVSYYELEAKPGTRFAHAHGADLARQADAMEGYFEFVIERLTAAGYRWYETANFCLAPEHAEGRDLRAHHNLAYWLGRDYLGLGIGAVSTIGDERRRNTPRLNGYLAALHRREVPEREIEVLDQGVRTQERVMLGLRLDVGLPFAAVKESVDAAALGRLEALGLASRRAESDGPETLVLTPRGRRLGGGVTAELLA